MAYIYPLARGAYLIVIGHIDTGTWILGFRIPPHLRHVPRTAPIYFIRPRPTLRSPPQGPVLCSRLRAHPSRLHLYTYPKP